MDTYALAFSVSNLGPKRFLGALNKFGSLEKAWKGTKEEYARIEIKEKTFDKFESFRKSFDFEKYVKKLEKDKVKFISYLDKDYPSSFKKLENPPIGLFIKGNTKLLKPHFAIGVVGTRKITEYGKTVTENLVKDLTQYGCTIVSGLALGVDGLSHRVCLENNGATVAVMPCGVDCCLPSENFSIYSQILSNDGMIISEYPLSLPPNKGTFLARNRLIAALSDGILITEAAEDSGSLVTAEWGFKLDKKVFAVPGPINSQMAQGSLKLLKQGAKLVTDAEDIFKEFKDLKSNNKSKLKTQMLKNLNKEEKMIFTLLENEELTIDEISKKSKLPVLTIMQSVGKMELKGIVKNSSGKFIACL